MDKKRNIKNSAKTIPTNKKYNANKRKALALRRRVGALLLAGGLVLGGIGVKAAIDRTNESRHITSMEEIEQYGLSARDLNISEKNFERLNDFQQKMNEVDMSSLSNAELAQYFNEFQSLQLDLLKDKVGNLIGRGSSEFALVAPGVDARTEIRSGTRVMEPDMVQCIAQIKSNDIDSYMEDILEARECSNALNSGDVNRNKMEDGLKDMVDGLGEVASMQLMREGLKGKEITSYRIEKDGLSPKTADLQQDRDR